MNLPAIKQLIKKHHWWSEECPGKWQYCYWINSAVEQKKYFHPKYLSVAFIVFQDYFLYEKTSEEEKIEQYHWLKNHVLEDGDYIQKEYKKWERVREKLSAQVSSVMARSGQWGKEELLVNYNKLLEIATDFVCWGFFLECVDPYNANILPRLVKQELPDVGEQEVNNLMIALSTPPVTSFMEEYQIARAEYILRHRADLKKELNDFVNKYKYLSVNYGGNPPLTFEEMLAQLTELAESDSDARLRQEIDSIRSKPDRIKREQIHLLQKYSFSSELLFDFDIMRQIGAWIDARKESMVKGSCAIWMILERISRLTEVSRQELEFYTEQEINNLLKDGERVAGDKLKKRGENSVFMTRSRHGEKADLEIFVDEDAKELARVLNYVAPGVLRGMVACSGGRGTFQGAVRVVLDVSRDGLGVGDILVTSMTRPDFLPIIKKASAIITDEGGITCHAAIVSRELGIPCVIGTKKATKILKSGDKIEINLSSGQIKKTL